MQGNGGRKEEGGRRQRETMKRKEAVNESKPPLPSRAARSPAPAARPGSGPGTPLAT